MCVCVYKPSLCAPTSNGGGGGGSRDHHEEGRLQYLILEEYDVLNTYAPNRTFKPEGIQRRKDWDAAMLSFLQG